MQESDRLSDRSYGQGSGEGARIHEAVEDLPQAAVPWVMMWANTRVMR
jgi:hypothetical protein